MGLVFHFLGSKVNETAFIFYAIAYFGAGYFLAHMFKTMGRTWEENPVYVLTAGVFGMIVVFSAMPLLEKINNLFITLSFASGFFYRFFFK